MSAARVYFAYGSNLYGPRMRARVPSAHVIGVAWLRNFRLAFRKLAQDGSTKCDLEPAPGETVWGVLYRFDPDEQDRLDAAEGAGYRRTVMTVEPVDGLEPVEVWTYRARAEWIGEGRPFTWYRALVRTGAVAHGFPDSYVAAVAAVRADPDPDPLRVAANLPTPAVTSSPTTV